MHAIRGVAKDGRWYCGIWSGLRVGGDDRPRGRLADKEGQPLSVHTATGCDKKLTRHEGEAKKPNGEKGMRGTNEMNKLGNIGRAKSNREMQGMLQSQAVQSTIQS